LGCDDVFGVYCKIVFSFLVEETWMVRHQRDKGRQ
jgi:hypothetical protein